MGAIRRRRPWDRRRLLGDDTRRIVRGPLQQASVLVIAGLDPSGGAGLLADAHVVSQHGFHVAGTVTALTEQDSVMCSWMHPTDPSMVSNQIARLIDDFEIRGVKIGMLANAEMAIAVARSAASGWPTNGVPIVIDPVLRATRGIPLLEGNARQALAPLLEMATVVTPEPRRAGDADRPITSPTTRTRCASQARRLKQFGPRAVLAKGGHLDGDIVDVLVDEEGDTAIRGRAHRRRDAARHRLRAVVGDRLPAGVRYAAARSGHRRVQSRARAHRRSARRRSRSAVPRL